ncbi:hypothetical protein [Streptomyces sp. JJ36]|uniref:hypothetical protein n=1 Tax=Streptomyces sp. JJ36 TaxID=2736645 RepID=UPI001F445010|nr:hypothetical protein [Streptomyces sp. JJ36]MCF6525103.1 hypothetical protein [Streptomyces sp. JJ36]
MNDDEPVFKRSRWGTNHYVYNPHNPVGLALILITVVVGAVVMLLMSQHAGPFASPSEPTPSSSPDEDYGEDVQRYVPDPGQGGTGDPER